MATYNGAHFVSEQLSSIALQEGIQGSVFISDDCSSDETLGLLKKALISGLSISFLPKLETTVGAGQNFFRLIEDVPLENFEYFAFADQDDIWLPKKLATAISKLDDQFADGYSSSVIAFWPSGIKRFIKKNYPQKKFDYFFEGPGPGCTFVMTRRLFLLLQEFVAKNQNKLRDIYYHDWFVYAFARSNGLKWMIDAQAQIYYRQHKKNDTGANAGISAAIFRIKKILGFWARDQVYVIAEVLGYDHILKYYFRGGLISILR